uniref:Uncharacterized protein n=2 Tax=Cacopsylla melanoneura TaxID=428564 RepID=A0A8D9EP03_9HEMI
MNNIRMINRISFKYPFISGIQKFKYQVNKEASFTPKLCLTKLQVIGLMLNTKYFQYFVGLKVTTIRYEEITYNFVNEILHVDEGDTLNLIYFQGHKEIKWYRWHNKEYEKIKLTNTKYIGETLFKEKVDS